MRGACPPGQAGHAVTRAEMQELVAAYARESQPPLPLKARSREARHKALADLARQAQQAWKTVTVVAAVTGMDAGWFRDCLETLGLLPSPSVPRPQRGIETLPVRYRRP
jgi:hypothetical protein